MNLTLITTTITPPTVLEQYRACDPNVLFIVAGDYGCDDDAIKAVCDRVGNAMYLSYEQQSRLGYACHESIGSRVVQRRNIALLEAIRTGCDAVVTIDTDNLNRNERYFADIRRILTEPFAGMMARSHLGDWFNPGAHGIAPYYYRGFPYSLRGRHSFEAQCVGSIVSATEQARTPGILNGMVLGDPDCSATERLDSHPVVTGYTMAMTNGILVDPTVCWAPFNTQNTAALRELAPLLGCAPAVGRYDDIAASWIACRVLEATDYGIHYGKPYVRQDRHEHDLYRDLELELWGMRWTDRIVEILRDAPVNPNDSVLENLFSVYSYLEHNAWADSPDDHYFLPEQTVRFMAAWLDDVARVL